MKPTPEILFIITYVAALIWAAFSVYFLFVAKRIKNKLTEQNESLSVEILNTINDHNVKIKSLEFDNRLLKNTNDALNNSLNEFKLINDSLVKSNNAALTEFENFVQLYANRNGVNISSAKRSVTSLGDKECIEIGEGDWARLAPLFEENDIRWIMGKKASDVAPEIGNCVSVNYFGKNELTQDAKSEYLQEAFTILPASDFIEPEFSHKLAPLDPTQHPNHPSYENPN
jgi:hypothetical protein